VHKKISKQSKEMKVLQQGGKGHFFSKDSRPPNLKNKIMHPKLLNGLIWPF